MKIYGATLIRPGFVGSLVTKTANQSISSGTATNLTWDTVEFDDGNFFDLGSDNDSAIIPAGVSHVDVYANVNWDAPGVNADSVARAEILKNGSTLDPPHKIALHEEDSTIGSEIAIIGLGIEVQEGDTIEIAAFQDNGVNVNVLSARTHFFIRPSFRG